MAAFGAFRKTEQNNNNAINTFKENLLTEIASHDSFISIPPSKAFEIEVKSNKGTQFIPFSIY